MEDIKLKDCEVINLKPNDIIIYRSNHNKNNIRRIEVDEMMNRLKIIFPKNKVIILFNGDSILAVKNHKLDK